MEQKYLDYLAQLGPIMPADVPPPMPGWYARDYSKYGEPDPDCWLMARDYWDGQHWHIGYDDGTHCDINATSLMPWRGLAEPTISAPAIADAMAADAASLASGVLFMPPPPIRQLVAEGYLDAPGDLEPVDVVTVTPHAGATRSEDAKVVPVSDGVHPNAAGHEKVAQSLLDMDGDMFAPELKPWLFYSVLAALVVVISIISWLVK